MVNQQELHHACLRSGGNFAGVLSLNVHAFGYWNCARWLWLWLAFNFN
jgi:hypothetical protein